MTMALLHPNASVVQMRPKLCANRFQGVSSQAQIRRSQTPAEFSLFSLLESGPTHALAKFLTGLKKVENISKSDMIKFWQFLAPNLMIMMPLLLLVTRKMKYGCAKSD